MTTTQPPPAPSGAFVFPRYHDFPPMYTIQPNAATRAAQLEKWSSLLQSYCAHHKLFRLAVPTAATTPSFSIASPTDPSTSSSDNTQITTHNPFSNPRIRRALRPDAARDVIAHMRAEGRAEWVDAERKDAAWIFWRTPGEWAAVIEAWLEETGQKGTSTSGVPGGGGGGGTGGGGVVLTLYEIRAGDVGRGSEMWGMDEEVLRMALDVLVKKGKARIFGEGESLGVKIF